MADLAGKGLLDNPRLRAAFQAIRREHFLPGVEPKRVYHDDAVTTQAGSGGMTTSSSSQPSIMAMMLAQLDPQPGDRVLEIGAGTGYNAALLAPGDGNEEELRGLFGPSPTDPGWRWSSSNKGNSPRTGTKQPCPACVFTCSMVSPSSSKS